MDDEITRTYSELKPSPIPGLHVLVCQFVWNPIVRKIAPSLGEGWCTGYVGTIESNIDIKYFSLAYEHYYGRMEGEGNIISDNEELSFVNSFPDGNKYPSFFAYVGFDHNHSRHQEKKTAMDISYAWQSAFELAASMKEASVNYQPCLERIELILIRKINDFKEFNIPLGRYEHELNKIRKLKGLTEVPVTTFKGA